MIFRTFFDKFWVRRAEINEMKEKIENLELAYRTVNGLATAQEVVIQELKKRVDVIDHVQDSMMGEGQDC